MTDEQLINETATRVLDAAERAFADHGFAGARVNGIAAAADVNKAMLYYYFDSKEGLYRAVLERVFDQVFAMLTAILARDNEPDIRGFLAGYRAILESHPDFVRLVLRDMADGGGHVVDILGPKVQRIVATFGGALQDGQKKGSINPNVNPTLTVPVLLAPFLFFIVANPMLTAVTGLPREVLAAPFNMNAEEILLRGLLARPLENP